MKPILLKWSMLSIVLLSLTSIQAQGDSTCHRTFAELPRPFAINHYFGSESGITFHAGGNGQIALFNKEGNVQTRQLATSADFNALLFNNDQVGYVVGTEGEIFCSIDRGKTWTEQKSGTKNDLEAIDCSDELTCLAVGANGTILSTVNGGRIWDSYHTGTRADLYSVSFASQSLGWAVGAGGMVLHTSDRGRTWKKLSDSKLAGAAKSGVKSLRFTSVKFFNESSGCIAGDGRIICTVDGGESWTYSQIDASFFGHKWLGFISSQEGLTIVGECPENDYLSFDNGKNWVPVKARHPRASKTTK